MVKRRTRVIATCKGLTADELTRMPLALVLLVQHRLANLPSLTLALAARRFVGEGAAEPAAFMLAARAEGAAARFATNLGLAPKLLLLALPAQSADLRLMKRL